MEQLNLQEYYDKLKAFDWFYEFSDDGRVWREGKTNHAILKGLSKTSERHEALYRSYETYINNCINRVPFENNPKPERPENTI
jgi:regulator of PEP synthase PpsR (kinase-PPPase family)